jgi:hypothetical protein
MFAFAGNPQATYGLSLLAAGRFLAGFPDPLEIPRVRTANTYGVVDAIAEAVRQDGVVYVSVAALSLWSAGSARGLASSRSIRR